MKPSTSVFVPVPQDFLPDVIYQLIDNGHMRQTTFSKFYLGCKALGGKVNELP